MPAVSVDGKKSLKVNKKVRSEKKVGSNIKKLAVKKKLEVNKKVRSKKKVGSK